MFPYEKDYFNHLLEKEDRQRRKYPFRAQSPQISGRGPLIDVIKESAAKLSLGPSTVHLSVYMLDLFMDSHDILPHQLILTAQTCLFVAAKYVDVDQNIPKISNLQALTNNRNEQHEYQTMEVLVLNFCGWDLNSATTIHFMDYLLSLDLLTSQDEKRLESHQLNDFKRRAMEFADLSLHEVQFNYFPPSVIAASCIAATRRYFNLFPTWPMRMEEISSYSSSDIDTCVNRLLHFAQITNPETFSPVLCEWRSPYQNSEQKRCKFKAPAKNTNCARVKRRYLHSRDIKKMYCAV